MSDEPEPQLFQMHDVTNGREFLGQCEFTNTQDFFEWGSTLAKANPGRGLEMVSDESPDFMPDKTSIPPFVAGIMHCDRCEKTCRCPHCNKF